MTDLTKEQKAQLQEYLAQKVIKTIETETKIWLKENAEIPEVTDQYFGLTSEVTITAISLALMSFTTSLAMMGVTSKPNIEAYFKWLGEEAVAAAEDVEDTVAELKGVP